MIKLKFQLPMFNMDIVFAPITKSLKTEGCHLLEYEAVKSGTIPPTFWLKVQQTCCLYTAGYLDYS
jgi:hypothetical protein